MQSPYRLTPSWGTFILLQSTLFPSVLFSVAHFVFFLRESTAKLFSINHHHPFLATICLHVVELSKYSLQLLLSNGSLLIIVLRHFVWNVVCFVLLRHLSVTRWLLSHMLHWTWCQVQSKTCLKSMTLLPSPMWRSPHLSILFVWGNMRLVLLCPFLSRNVIIISLSYWKRKECRIIVPDIYPIFLKTIVAVAASFGRILTKWFPNHLEFPCQSICLSDVLDS